MSPISSSSVGAQSPAESRVAPALASVRERIRAAAVAAGRLPETVRLVAVTKTVALGPIRAALAAGQVDLGENRDQEAAAKAEALDGADVRWHLIGRLQTNKAHSVIRYAAMVQSVDRPKLADALDHAAMRAERVLDVLIQISLDGDPRRGGIVPAELPALADRIERAPHLALRGLMAVPPLGMDPARAFTEVARLRTTLIADHPSARELSLGMSDDFEAAIGYGATIVRVGSAIFGKRSSILE